MADDVKIVTIKEAAQMLGISLDTVRRHIKAHKLQAVKVDTRHGVMWKVSIPVEELPPAVGKPVQDEQSAVSDVYIKSLLERVAFLEAELKRRGDEVQQLYGMLAQKALPAPRPWWKRLARG